MWCYLLRGIAPGFIGPWVNFYHQPVKMHVHGFLRHFCYPAPVAGYVARVADDGKLGPAPFPYDNPALVSVPLAFAISLAVSLLDRSAAAASVRASFGAQHVRAQTGLGIE